MAGARAEAGEFSASFLVEFSSSPVFSRCNTYIFFFWIVCFLDVFGISSSIICFQQKDNNQHSVMQVFKPAPHIARVTLCLHYGGLSELLQGLQPVDGKAPAKLVFFHKDV